MQRPFRVAALGALWMSGLAITLVVAAPVPPAGAALPDPPQPLCPPVCVPPPETIIDPVVDALPPTTLPSAPVELPPPPSLPQVASSEPSASTTTSGAEAGSLPTAATPNTSDVGSVERETTRHGATTNPPSASDTLGDRATRVIDFLASSPSALAFTGRLTALLAGIAAALLMCGSIARRLVGGIRLNGSIRG